LIWAWAVAKSLGLHVTMTRGGWFVFDSDAFSEFRNDYNDDKLQSFRPSTDWAQGGVIIEREKISIEHLYGAGDAGADVWVATRVEGSSISEEQGSTALIAAMRCYVASKQGESK
jgi:hypothetical protein